MRGRLVSLLPALIGCILAGCQPPAPTPAANAPATLRASLPPAPPQEQTKQPNTFLLAVRLSLSAIEVPGGTVSSSEGIWSYLDEESVSMVRSGGVGRNGMRVARGRADAWPDITRIVKETCGRQFQMSTFMTPPGRAVPVALKTGLEEQTIFLFRPDGTLHGEDYPPGDNIISFYCTLDEDDPSRVWIAGTPQIRTTRKGTRFVQSAGGLAMVDRPDYYTLSELTFRTVLAKNDFLVIGPGADSIKSTSVGHCFLMKQRDGLDFETLLIVKAEVLAAPS